MAARAIRIFLGLIFFTAGMAKLFAGHQFPGLIGPVWLEEELAKYGLGLYARFIAYSQVAIGFLLLTRRFATVGAIMLVPLIANILVVTVSLQWRGTPFVNAALLGMNLWLLWADRAKLQPLLGSAPRLPLFAAGGALVLASPALSRAGVPLGWGAAAAGLFLALWSNRTPSASVLDSKR